MASLRPFLVSFRRRGPWSGLQLSEMDLSLRPSCAICVASPYEPSLGLAACCRDSFFRGPSRVSLGSDAACPNSPTPSCFPISLVAAPEVLRLRRRDDEWALPRREPFSPASQPRARYGRSRRATHSSASAHSASRCRLATGSCPPVFLSAALLSSREPPLTRRIAIRFIYM